MSETPCFQLDGVSLDFGDTKAVNNLSLNIAEGETLALIGPSGGGKTSLLRLFNTTLLPTSGEIRVLGSVTSALTPRELRNLRARIATIPQNLGLVPSLTALQNVLHGKGGQRSTLRSLKDLLNPSAADVERVYSLLDRVGIEEKLYQPVARLSGGQQQRVAIARALFQEPDVLLADEPVSAVDPARARDLVSLLSELAREHQLTLCMSLHDVKLAQEFFPRVIGMRRGKAALDSPPEKISADALTELYQLDGSELAE